MIGMQLLSLQTGISLHTCRTLQNALLHVAGDTPGAWCMLASCLFCSCATAAIAQRLSLAPAG